MILGCISESADFEKRVMLNPEGVKKIKSLGIDVMIPKNYGNSSDYADDEYVKSGATISDNNLLCEKSDIILKISQRNLSEFKFKQGANLIIGFFNQTDNDATNLVKQNKQKVFALNLLPRITRAQAMDVLSSQANLAGYKAVIDTAYEFQKALPMMMTAAGTVTPAKYFILGAGVAGLQAIATAKRLGAVVSATDVRLASKEQVESLGAKFVFVEDAEDMETSGGYAKEASDEFKKKQEILIKDTVKSQDIIICTALIPGKKAPRIITEEMVLSMRPGSVICDLAAAQGGNCAFSEPDKIIEKNGVKILGYSNYASRIPGSASALLSKNLLNFINLIFNKEKKTVEINHDDEIIKGVLLK